jgi:hypothetical protein
LQSAYSISDSLVRQIFVRAAGQCDLLYFARYVDRDFQSPAHIKMIADKLTAVKEGSCKRLIINMPPRHGKSHLTSKIFPAWYIGNNPKAQFIIASYAATLATEFSRWIRNTTKDQYYQDIFDVKLKDDSQAADRWETSEGGVMVGAGVGGAITGRGADLSPAGERAAGCRRNIARVVAGRRVAVAVGARVKNGLAHCGSGLARDAGDAVFQ